MSITKTQQYLYFQNKAKHYQQLKTIKPAISSNLHHNTNNNSKAFLIKNTTNSLIQQISFTPNKNLHQQSKKSQQFHVNNCEVNQLKTSLKVGRQMTLRRQHEIQVQNEHLINRLVNIVESPRVQLNADGKYSRYYKVQRKFRTLNPYASRIKEQIQQSNKAMRERLLKSKPKIGSSVSWNIQYNKTLDCTKHISRYHLSSNISKQELHLSFNQFVPEHIRDYAFLNQSSLNDSIHFHNKQVVISKEKMLELPPIYHQKNHQWKNHKSFGLLQQNQINSVSNPEIQVYQGNNQQTIKKDSQKSQVEMPITIKK